MSIAAIGKSIATLLLALSLVGCVDVTVDIAVTSPTTVTATMTQVMGAEFYTMVKLDEKEAGKDAPVRQQFCDSGSLTENQDGSATCVMVEQGPFGTIAMGTAEQSVTFTKAGPGLIRIAFPTASIETELSKSAADAETTQMVDAFFAGRKLTIRFSGAAVTESNMTISDDGTSAQQVIAFRDLLSGKADLPQTLYAVVRAP